MDCSDPKDCDNFWSCAECNQKYVALKISDLMDRDTQRLLQRIRSNKKPYNQTPKTEQVHTLADLLR